MQDVTDELTTYDLVSHGTDTQGQNECYGTYNDTTGIATGAGYTSSCLHSGATEHSGGDTVWYNYAIASASTIVGIDNINTTNESVCPKGWTLPSRKQIDNNKDTVAFSPVFGGHYNDGSLNREAERGYWWSSDMTNSALRHSMNYDGNRLYGDSSNRRFIGFYIRCVSEEKTATDLTYMQDIASWYNKRHGLEE